MPKVKINNTQGLVQATGGGIALYGATESLTAAGSGGTQIAETTSLALCNSTADADIIVLPDTTNLETGHTVVVVNVSSNKEFHLKAGAGTRINGVNATDIPDIKEGSSMECVYSGAANPGWIVVVGDNSTLPT